MPKNGVNENKFDQYLEDNPQFEETVTTIGDAHLTVYKDPSDPPEFGFRALWSARLRTRRNPNNPKIINEYYIFEDDAQNINSGNNRNK